MSHSRNVDHNTIGDNSTIHQGDINNVFNYAQDFCTLLGLGGVGKSQLAIEFAYRIAEKHSDVWVFWIHAATQARVGEGFRMIAEAVKLPERKQPTADMPLPVRNWLSNEPNGRWIIILDSADNSEVLYSPNQSGHDQRPLAAYLPQRRNGSILLTTRNRNLASKLTGGYKDIIEVGTMTETDALDLLEKKMGSPLSPLDAGLAKDLVKALECIPLAISQAAAYIQARKPRSSIEKYLVEFRKSEQGSMKLLEYEANDIGAGRRDIESNLENMDDIVRIHFALSNALQQIFYHP